MAEDTPEGVWDNYNVEGNSLERTNVVCPKCSDKHFMAEHDDRRTCGKTGYTEFKDTQ